MVGEESTKPQKIADRPHTWTVALSITAIAVSIVSAGVSLFDFILIV